METTCCQCGKIYDTKPSRAKPPCYCSQSCYHESQKGIPVIPPKPKPKIKCETCGKIFEIYPSRLKYDNPRFCSTNCFYKWLKGSRRAEYVDVRCLTCRKPMQVLKSKYDDGRGRYCSQKCMIIDRPKPPKRKKIPRKCKHCGKKFKVYPSWVKNGDGIFCSRSCVASHTNRNMRLKNGPTSIEQLLLDELDRRRIGYEFQYPATGWTIDIAFPSRRLAVEADGVYWHSLDNVIEKDERKDADLKEKGWTVLHFDGDRIRESAKRCVDEIVTHLAF